MLTTSLHSRRKRHSIGGKQYYFIQVVLNEKRSECKKTHELFQRSQVQESSPLFSHRNAKPRKLVGDLKTSKSRLVRQRQRERLLSASRIKLKSLKFLLICPGWRLEKFS